MLVDLEVFYLGHLKNFYTIQYNTIYNDTWNAEPSNYYSLLICHMSPLTTTYE